MANIDSNLEPPPISEPFIVNSEISRVWLQFFINIQRLQGNNSTAVDLNTTHRTSDGTDHSDVVLNNTHRTSNGTDHTYIDQDVTISSSPTFNGLTTTGGRVVSTTRLTFIDSPYTVLSTDEVIFANTDSGAITINLPAGIDGTHYRISNTGSSSNDVTINRNGAEQVYNNNFQILKDSDVLNMYYNTNDGWF